MMVRLLTVSDYQSLEDLLKNSPTRESAMIAVDLVSLHNLWSATNLVVCQGPMLAISDYNGSVKTSSIAFNAFAQ